MREGSAWHDVRATVKSLTETCADSRRAILVSDDSHPDTLLSAGHLDHVVCRAISEGLSPVRAIQAVTINTAECFGMGLELGAIAPGRFADILFLKDLAGVEVERVMADGRVLAEKEGMVIVGPCKRMQRGHRSSHIFFGEEAPGNCRYDCHLWH